MKSSRRSKVEILDAYRALASELGRTPSQKTFVDRTGIKLSEVLYHWVNWGDVAQELELIPNQWEPSTLSDEEVFSDYARICLHVGEIPTRARLRKETRELGTRTHRADTRFGTLANFEARFRAWLTDQDDPELRAILDFPGRKPTRARGDASRRGDATAVAVAPLRPFLPAGLQGLEALSRGDRPSHEDPSVSVSLLFERRVADAFRCLGFDVVPLGQGTGRKADCLAIARRDGFGAVIDAKSRAGTYKLGTEDRKFLEYSAKHSQELESMGIKRAYFVVVATSFRDSDLKQIRSYLTQSAIKTAAFLTAADLTKTVEESIRNRASFSLEEFERELASGYLS